MIIEKLKRKTNDGKCIAKEKNISKFSIFSKKAELFSKLKSKLTGKKMMLNCKKVEKL